VIRFVLYSARTTVELSRDDGLRHSTEPANKYQLKRQK